MICFSIKVAQELKSQIRFCGNSPCFFQLNFIWPRIQDERSLMDVITFKSFPDLFWKCGKMKVFKKTFFKGWNRSAKCLKPWNISAL